MEAGAHCGRWSLGPGRRAARASAAQGIASPSRRLDTSRRCAWSSRAAWPSATRSARRSARKSPWCSLASDPASVRPTRWAHTSPGHPRLGRTDAERNCISNIRAEGLSYAQAAAQLGYYLTEARRRQLTGVALKEEAHPAEGGLRVDQALVDSRNCVCSWPGSWPLTGAIGPSSNCAARLGPRLPSTAFSPCRSKATSWSIDYLGSV